MCNFTIRGWINDVFLVFFVLFYLDGKFSSVDVNDLGLCTSQTRTLLYFIPFSWRLSEVILHLTIV